MEISVLGLVDNTMVVENLQHTATPGVGLPYCTEACHVDHNLSFNAKFLVWRFFLQTTRTHVHESLGRTKAIRGEVASLRLCYGGANMI